MRLKLYRLNNINDGVHMIRIPEDSEIIGISPIGRVGQVTNMAIVCHIVDESIMSDREVVIATIPLSGESQEVDLDGLDLMGSTVYSTVTGGYVTTYLFG